MLFVYHLSWHVELLGQQNCRNICQKVSLLLSLKVKIRCQLISSKSNNIFSFNPFVTTKGSLKKKKNSKKGDIVTIRSETYLPYLNSDTKFSDICSKTFFLHNSDTIFP